MFVVRQEIKCTANKIFVVHFFIAHGKGIGCRVFFLCRAPYEKCTANNLFAMRPK
jgi:hypothetical protein